MIRFEVIRWRNFLSTGSSWNEIQLNAYPTNLIVGDNGSGKSTILDALCFVLFGTPFRNVNKPQLLNSINLKECEVQVEFSIGKKSYEIRRGIRPNLFEIYQDGVLLNQDASVKDYQQILEQQIIKFSKRAFTQIVILGSASFTPFMQLKSGERREMIEDLLDIKLFSAMNRVLKDKYAALAVELTNLETTITIAKNQAATQKRYIETLTQDKQEQITQYRNQIAETETNIEKLETDLSVVLDKVSKLAEAIADQTEIQAMVNKVEVEVSKTNDTITKLNKEIQFYAVNDVCPTCKQDIETDHKCSIVEKREAHKTEAHSNLSLLVEAQKDLRAKLAERQTIGKKIHSENITAGELNTQIAAAKAYVAKLQAEMTKVKENTGNIEEEQEKMRLLAVDIVEYLKRRAELNEEKEYFNAAAPLLKDTGFKTKVIKQYLPLINKLVNKYLQAMDLFIQFELDEAFNETIKSRHRDEFTYASFSEGEKQRINLALLFAWRSVAALRNTTNTNLLLFDEVLDGSLDATAVDLFLNLVKEIGIKTNIFVITHKQDLFVDRFDRVIKVQKVGGYSITDSEK